MKIVGIDGMSPAQLQQELAKGGKFVIYQYCVSILVMSFKRSSSIYFVPAGMSSAKAGLKFSAASLVGGWWGFPWGPIWTISTVFRNARGGLDVTGEVINALQARAPIPAAS